MENQLRERIGSDLGRITSGIAHKLGITTNGNGIIHKQGEIESPIERYYLEQLDWLAWHTKRNCIYSALISDLLGFDKSAKKLYFLAMDMHDELKLTRVDLLTQIGKTEEETSEIIKNIRHNHIDHKKISWRYGGIVSSAIELHHHHQGKVFPKYPLTPQLKITPESWFLSQLIAVADWYDSSRTRPCPSGEPGHISEQQTYKRILQEYGELEIAYTGNFFPTIAFSGRDLIERLYKQKIFGRRLPEALFLDKSIPSEHKETYFRNNPFYGIEIN